MNRRKIFLIFVIGLISISNKLYSQDRIKRTLQFSARYTFYYNYKVAHHSPVFSIEFNKHNFYLGPEYSLILKPIKGDPVNIYEKKSFGINLNLFLVKSHIVLLLSPFTNTQSEKRIKYLLSKILFFVIGYK